MDLATPSESDVFTTTGFGAEGTIGAGITAGTSLGDIEGTSEGFDINHPAGGIAWGQGADGAGYAALTVGPGGGIFTGISNTTTTTIRSIWQGIVSLFSPSRPDSSSNSNSESQGNSNGGVSSSQSAADSGYGTSAGGKFGGTPTTASSSSSNTGSGSTGSSTTDSNSLGSSDSDSSSSSGGAGSDASTEELSGYAG